MRQDTRVRKRKETSMLNKHMRSKLYSYALKTMGLREYRRGWLKGVCPDCGRHDKFGFNISQNRTNCFVCGYHPSPIRLVMENEGLEDYNAAKAYLNTYEGRTYLEPVIERIERIDTVLPEGYKNLMVGEGRLGRTARSYVYNRGFDVEEMALKGWGYGTKDEYFGYIIIPFYAAGKLIYYNARRFMGSGPKYSNPKIEDFGLGKSLIMYNMDALAIYETIYLVEGAINAETIGDEGVATGGKKISHYQLSMISKSPVENVVILLDPDALDDAIKVGLELAYHKNIKLITLPEDKDVNDIGHIDTMELVANADWLTYNKLLRYHHTLRS